MRVGVAHDFFAKELRAYSDWKLAWIRELVQNGVDCGSRNISFTFESHPDGCLATVRNDGPPMSREVLLDKFLNLGGTTKTGQDSVGGYGIAKTVIAFAHKHYEIHTGNLVVRGSGGEFELTEEEPVAGTQTTVLLNASADEMARKTRYYLGLCQLPRITFTVNGETTESNLHKGSKQAEFSWGIVYTNHKHSARIIVRMHGITMFCRYVSYQHCVIVELTGANTETLQSNRDALNYQYQEELDKFIIGLSVDKVSAFRPPRISKTHYKGQKLTIGDLVPARAQASSQEIATPVLAALAVSFSGQSLLPTCQQVACKEQQGEFAWLPDFVLSNDTGLETPKHYEPRNFSNYSKKLLHYWAHYLLALRRLFLITEPFSVGFCLSTEAGAVCETDDQYGTVFYVNPATVIKQTQSNSRSFANRWTFNHAGRMKLLATALHEVVHGLGYNEHDERYAGRLTEAFGQLLSNLKGCR